MFALDSPHFPLGRGGHTTSAHAFVLEALFTRKLGIAGPLNDGRFSATATARFLSLDCVEDPLGTQISEWTAMLSYEVVINQGAALLPQDSESYSRLIWVNSDILPKAASSRDILALDETLDPIKVCLHGLCIRVAASMFS
jgi:hypothetical protein